MSRLHQTVVLISGNGSNLQALIDAEVNISSVISNRKAAFGLERAKRASIPTVYFPWRRKTQSREDYDLALVEQVMSTEPDLVVLAGWMHILSETFLNNLKVKVINLHPALPGEFPGINAIARAFEAFQKGEITQTGVMVHEVIPEVDAGRVLLSQAIPLRQGESLDMLKERVHKVEHPLLVQAVQQEVERWIKDSGT